MSTALSSRARNGAGGGIYRSAMGETDDDDDEFGICGSDHNSQSIQPAGFLLVLKGSVATAMSARVSRCPSSVFGTVSSCAMGETDDDDKFLRNLWQQQR